MRGIIQIRKKLASLASGHVNRPRRLAAGGLEGDRTLGLCVANAALSQLSYKPL